MILLKCFDRVVWTLLSLFLVGASNLKCEGFEASFFIFSLCLRSVSSLLSSNNSRPAVLSTSEMGGGGGGRGGRG